MNSLLDDGSIEIFQALKVNKKLKDLNLCNFQIMQPKRWK